MENREEYNEEFDRREYRRKRRIRNQIITYVVTTLMLAAVIVGAAFGIHKAVTVFNDKKHEEELQAQLAELAESEPAVVEAPAADETESEPEAEGEETDYLSEIVEGRISEMPLEDKVAGLFIITPEALTGTDVATKAGDATKEKLAQYAVGGLVYFKQNISSAEQITEMITNTKNNSKYALFIGVDEEGGSVSRVAESGLADNVGSMGEIGASADAAKAREAGAAIGGYLSEYGFNLDFAPVADVITEGNTTIGDRSFGTDPNLVSPMVAAGVEGIQSTGVSACLKHFPGLGDTTEDTHEGMASSEKTMEDLNAVDFPVFQAGIDAGADFVMVSHLSLPNVMGDNTPSSLSPQMVTDALRGQLGFDGIIITDSLSMTAITDYYTADEAAVKALAAGVDMLLMPEDFELAYNGVLEAVHNGTITEERINESLRRIYRVKSRGQVE